MPPASNAPPTRRRLSDSSSSSKSNEMDDEEKEALRKFAREMYIQMNPTESNPNNLPRRSMVVAKNKGSDHAFRHLETRTQSSSNKELTRTSLFRNTSAPVPAAPKATTTTTTTPRKRWKRAALKVRTVGRVFTLLKNKTKKKRTVKHYRVNFASPGTVIDGAAGAGGSVKSNAKLERVRCIETLDEFLEEGVAADIWFSRDELDRMKRDAFDLAAVLERAMEAPVGDNENDDHPEGCFRGLEAKTEGGNWEAYKARKDVVNIVLDEQDRRSDALVIGEVSREMTKLYAKQAVERAARDARIATKLLQEQTKPPRGKRTPFRSFLKAFFAGSGRPSGAHFAP